MPTSPQVMARLSVRLRERLYGYAAAQGYTSSQVQRMAIEEYLDRHGERSHTEHLTDDDVLAGIQNLVEHGPHVMTAGEVIMKIKEMVT